MVITLTMTESSNQKIAGVPEYVEFATSIPATVFYTFDGTEPTENSYMASGEVYLPTEGIRFTLKAVAISGDSESTVLEQVYYTEQADLERFRLNENEGVNIFPYGSTSVDHLSYDADGNESQQTSVDFNDLDLITSTTNSRGEDVPDGSTVEFIRFPTILKQSGPSIRSSPNDNNIDFDPKASLIVVDGSTQSKVNDQVVQIINRPMNSMEPVSPFYSKLSDEEQLVSANLSKTIYDPSTGIMISYYYDNRENRWIKSTQQLDAVTLKLEMPTAKSRYVFKWIDFRAMSKIF